MFVSVFGDSLLLVLEFMLFVRVESFKLFLKLLASNVGDEEPLILLTMFKSTGSGSKAVLDVLLKLFPSLK